MELTQEKLKQALRYDEVSGLFYWLGKRLGAPKNRPAGRLSKSHGYVDICIDATLHRAHRLAWLYVTGKWPDGDIDHIDRNKSNNAWANLRECSRQANMLNVWKSPANTSGITGVSWDSSRKKWLAQIRINGKKKNLGRYSTKNDALAAWIDAAGKDLLFSFRNFHDPEYSDS